MENLTEPREIRKLLRRAAHMGERIDGKPSRMPSMTSNIVRQIMNVAEANGLSGEDAMTLLAYHALLMYERLTDQLLDDMSITPPRMPAPPPRGE